MDASRRRLLKCIPALVAVPLTAGAVSYELNPQKRHVYFVDRFQIDIEQFAQSDLPPGPMYAVDDVASAICIYEVD